MIHLPFRRAAGRRPAPGRARVGLLVGVLLLAGAAVVPAVNPDPAAAVAGPTPSASVYRNMPTDPTAVVLGSERFPVHGDGVGDDTASVQAAIDEASRRGGENWLGNIVGGARNVTVGDGGGVVFVPQGRYRLSRQVDLHASVRLIGFGATRPEFVLGDATPGFQQGNQSFLFAALRRPHEPGAARSFGNNDTFGTGLVNLDIRIGSGNPAAVAVRFSGAQMFVLQDLDIHVGDGYAGIDHNANLIQRVNVYGGTVGMLAFAASPGWQTTLLDTTFSGQREAAVKLHTDSKLSLIRNRFLDSPAGIVATPGQTQRLYVQDSVFENISGSAITLNDSASVAGGSEPELIRAQNQLNVVDTGVSGTGALLTTVPSGHTWAGPGPSYLVRDATLGLRVHDALGADERRADGVLVAATPAAPASFTRLLTPDAPLPPDTGDWVNVVEYAAARGVTVGTGTSDDHAIFQRAIDEHDTVYVPMGRYLIGDTLRLRPQSNLIGLHPRQTWLKLPDRAPGFTDPEQPKAMVQTPLGGRNQVTGLGLDSAQQTAGSVQVHWRSGERSYLADIATQFVKWHPEQTTPGDPGAGDPGYQYRGRHKYSFWVQGGGGTFANIWSVAGWADNGFLIEDTSVRGRMYEVSVEHHEHREVVLRRVRNWELHALQTEDHIYGWRSQAVELDDVHDVLFGNTVFFRVATVQGPYPYAVGLRDSSGIVIRGTRGYRPDNVANTRWGATIADVSTGRTVPEIEVAYLGVGVPGPAPTPAGVHVALDAPEIQVLPGRAGSTVLRVRNDGPGTLTGLALDVRAPDGWQVRARPDAGTLRAGGTASIAVDVQVPADTVADGTVGLAVAYTRAGRRQEIPQTLRIRVAGENLARGAAVQATSVLSTNVASNAVDGDRTGTRWISGAGDPAPTLTVDLGQPAQLARLDLYSGVAGSTALRVRAFRVEALVDGAWTSIGSVAANTASPVGVDLAGAPAGIRQVRLVFTEPSPTDATARVFEVEIHGIRQG
ncbi:glycosyl hydrolase family 28-related protein [Micromonospora sp. NPDC047074]|uniref:glycosyl hydrolase family 28-related protein n=1 Tax=Micromonospora sp. NPDC047074 TaxID=3154339 RepID=UPI0033FCE882